MAAKTARESAKAKEERLLDTALWYKALKETSNASFLPLIFDRSRYLVLKGGGGSGKSIFAGRKVLELCTSEPGHRWLVVRKVAKTLRESCFEQLKAQAWEHYPQHVAFIPKGKSGDMYIRLYNGSEILFAGLDDVAKLKSIYAITGVWIEEASELDDGDFNQLDIRLRTDFEYGLQMILSFNPVNVTHWLKARFFDRHDERAKIHESTYKDNRFLDAEEIKTLEGFKDIDEYYYTVYCLGQWGVTGKTVFNAQEVSGRLRTIGGPLRTGLFEYDDVDGVEIGNIRWVDDPHGPVKIYKDPEAGRPYVIGGDTAGDGSDWFTGVAIDNVTGEQVAVLRHQYDEDTYAKQMYCLGKHYNDALLAPECNFSTYPVKLLGLMGYKKLYVREVEDSFDGKVRHAFGFKTDRVTRPVIVSELIRVLRGNASLINDRETLEELLTFVRGDDLRPAAEPGAHDDLVIALAIAHYVRPQQSMRVELAESEGNSEWTKDMWEDYDKSDAKTRKLLEGMWGKPARRR